MVFVVWNVCHFCRFWSIGRWLYSLSFKNLLNQCTETHFCLFTLICSGIVWYLEGIVHGLDVDRSVWREACAKCRCRVICLWFSFRSMSVRLIGVIWRASHFVFIHVLDWCFSGGLYSIRFFANPVGTWPSKCSNRVSELQAEMTSSFKRNIQVIII